VKILRLTTSNDLIHQGPGSRLDWLNRLGREQYGDSFDVVSRTVWPDARLPRKVAEWVAEERPDVVWMLVPSFWFEYLSVPKMLSRKFGRVGKLASDAGFKAADNPRLSHNAVFRTGRRLLQRTIGGDPHFTTDELYATVEEIARVVLRDEGVQFVVYGPFSYQNFSASRKQERATLRRRTDFIRRLRALAGESHFVVEAPDRPRWQTDGEVEKHADRFHMAAEVQRPLAEQELRVLARAVGREVTV